MALLLVDLSAVFWWKWHASAGQSVDTAFEYTTGKVTQLAHGYERASVVVCCDSGKSFRNDLDPPTLDEAGRPKLGTGYKGNRPPRDEAAIAQLKRATQWLREYGFHVVAAPGFEADDVIATIVAWARQRPELAPVVIAGTDKDLLQLVDDEACVSMLKVTTDAVLREADVQAAVGVPPRLVRDLLAICGDSADNVKGVRGVGAKTAAPLLLQFGGLAAICGHIAETNGAAPRIPHQRGVRAAFVDQAKALDLAVKLVSLRFDAPVDFDALLRAPEPVTPEAVVSDEPAAAAPFDPAPVAPTLPPPPPTAHETQPAAERPTIAEEKSMTQNAPANVPPSDRTPAPAEAQPVRAVSRFSAQSVTTAADVSAHKFILTGRSGIGKTFLVSTIPSVFILPIEEGLKGASPDHAPAHFKMTPRNLRELHEALDGFAGDVNAPVDGRRPHKHLVLDSLTGIETLVHNEVSSVEKVAHMEAKEYKKLWRAAEPVWLKVQRKLDAIRHTGVHVWVIAHSAEMIDASSTTGETYRKWDLLLKGSGDVGVEMRNMWRGWADHIFFIDWTVEVSKGNRSTRSVGKYKSRILYTRESATHYAKTRARLPPSLPATWDDLEAALKAGRVAPEQRLRAQIAELLPQLSEENRAAIEADMAAATPTRLAPILSRAQGMLACAREDAAEDEAVGGGDEQTGNENEAA